MGCLMTVAQAVEYTSSLGTQKKAMGTIRPRLDNVCVAPDTLGEVQNSYQAIVEKFGCQLWHLEGVGGGGDDAERSCCGYTKDFTGIFQPVASIYAIFRSSE